MARWSVRAIGQRFLCVSSAGDLCNLQAQSRLVQGQVLGPVTLPWKLWLHEIITITYHHTENLSGSGQEVVAQELLQ